MRTLAELIMKGRSQAVLVAVVAAMLPFLYWISAAAVCLVTLRRGVTDGSQLLLWALLPAGVWALAGDPTALIVIAGSYVLAALLRRSMSWIQVLIGVIPVGIVASFGLELGLGSMLDQVLELVSQQESGAVPQLQALASYDLKVLIIGAVTAFHAAVMLASLALARWWQACLFNPGGFGQEFRNVRLKPVFTLVLVTAVVLLPNIGAEMVRWMPLLMLPLIVAGMALVHGIVAKRELAKGWLTGFYLSLALFGPYVLTLLVISVAIDSLIDLRSRIPAKN